MEELRKRMSASQELLGMHESFKIKVNQAYRDKSINSVTYSNLMLCLRDIYCVVKSLSMSQERDFERGGGRFYNKEEIPSGMLIRKH